VNTDTIVNELPRASHGVALSASGQYQRQPPKDKQEKENGEHKSVEQQN
jgi:hypothetical protein